MVAVILKKLDQTCGRDPRACGEPQHAAREGLAWRYPLGHRTHRCQHDPARCRRLGQSRQHVNASAQQVRVGRDPIIGQAIPGRENQHLDLGHEKSERRQKLIDPRIVPTDVDQIGHKPTRHETAEHVCIMAFGRAMDQDLAWSGKQRMKRDQRPRP